MEWRSDVPSETRLLTREWEWLPNAKPAAKEASWTILQFNVLAEALCCEESDWGGFTQSPRAALAWPARRACLLHCILDAPWGRPDIICLEELDHYHDWFEPALRQEGYDSLFAPKPDSPGLQFGSDKQPDGCGVFWRVDRLRLERHSILGYELPDGGRSNQVALICHFRHLSSGHDFVVASTHLKAKAGASNEAVRLAAIQQLLNELQRFDQWPAVLAGDFNTEPAGQVYTTVNSHELGLKSAYGLHGAASEPAYTTWKIRKSEAKHCIDYIWFTAKSLQLTRRLRLMGESGSVIGPERLPSWAWPSDHLSLMAEFCFL